MISYLQNVELHLILRKLSHNSMAHYCKEYVMYFYHVHFVLCCCICYCMVFLFLLKYRCFLKLTDFNDISIIDKTCELR